MLKKARLENKISLEDLQESTKIRKRYLEAIEDGNYKVLPGNFYVRAFIKSYAEAVGLDPNEVLQMYHNVIPSPEPEHIEPIRTKRTIRNTERIGKWASNVMVISFVVLILGIIYYFVNMNYTGGTEDTADGLPNSITDKIAPAPQQAPAANGDAGTGTVTEQQAPEQIPVPVTPEAPQTEVKLVKSERNTDFYSVAGVKELSIEMTVTGDRCWVEVESAGTEKKVLASQNFLNGNTQTWVIPNTARVVLGKASAVELTINGTPINVGDEANVKRIQIDLLPS
nr:MULTISPECIES: RodZ domain-containing protein [unclassified Paenibacillus]